LRKRLGGNAFEDYLRKPESDFHWQPTKLLKDSWGSIGYYELISQTWRGHKWSHQLVIVKPNSIRNPDIALLQISGDGTGEKQIANLKTLAERGGAVTAVLMNVPNQPFYDNRREDALIAYTLNQYLKSGDETWPLLFPMVKSAIKAMDAI
jgi:PhoPQ-activated pathogenicity-related protein